MKNVKQRNLLLLLTFLTLFFGVGRAQDTSTRLDITNGSITFTADGYTQAGSSGASGTGPVTITGTTTDTNNKVAVTGGEHVITLDGASIQFNDGSSWSTGTCAFSIANGAKVTLVLKGTNTLKSGIYQAGLQVPSGAKLEIKEGESGSLTATGGGAAAGIGGGSSGSGGEITISGGTVTATGGDYAAGIGSGNGGSGGEITISGGTVTANGGYHAAGIGGCDGGSGGEITISGGEVTANGGSYGAGIGGGLYGSGGEITISGGTVTANGGYYEAGIGGGPSGSGGEITISGGEVTAKGKIGGENSTITLSGSKVTVEGYMNGSTLTLFDSKVTVKGEIGGGNLTITNGTITTSSINADVAVKPGSGTTLSAPEGTTAITLTANHSLTVEKDASLTINTPLENKMHCLVRGTLVLGSQASITNSDDGGFFATSDATCPSNASITQPRPGEFLTDDLVLIGGGTEGTDFTITKNDQGYETITIQNNTPLTFRTPWGVMKSHILVPDGVTADITLEGCRIGKEANKYTPVDIKYAPIELSGRAVATVHLLGDNKLLAGKNCAGIQVPTNSSLTIKGEGKLLAFAGLYAAGIGGGIRSKAGTIRIESGTITAYGGATDGGNDAQNRSGGAGIGGGGAENKNGGGSHTKIVITGGHIVASAGHMACNIGACRNVEAPDAEISIQGGYVDGSCGTNANRTFGTINISGGTLKGNIKEKTGTLNITGGSVSGTIPSGVTMSQSVYRLTLENVASTVNSVSVDDTPYYIDQGYLDTDNENKNKLYLYVPKETLKVYVREDNVMATYSVTWSVDTPTATRYN